jgi:orotate phosphoribosyltransferase
MTSPDLVHVPVADLAARALLDADAYLIDFHRRFKWKSGLEAPVYTDCRRLNLNPGARAIVKRTLGTALRANYPHAEIAVGVAEAGIVWSAYAADEAGLQHAFVRKTLKRHGPQAGLSVECNPRDGLRAVIVDDLLASGASVLDAIAKVRAERKMEVIGVLTVVNWDFRDSREVFRRQGIPVRALVSYPQILRECLRRRIVTQAQHDVLYKFYANPTDHQWQTSEAFDEIQEASKQ